MKAVFRLLLGLTVFATALAGPIAVPTARAATKLPVEGYLMADDGARSVIARNAAGIAMVGIDGVTLNSHGSKLTTVPASAKAMVAEAHARGLKVELLVSNYSNRLGDFSTPIAGRLLTSKKHRTAVVKSLVYKVKKRHFDGVQIDLESLKRSHGPGLTAFVKQLRAALPARKTISMAVMASSRPRDYLRSGYQLTKLTKRINRFVLMAYDQHGPGWSKAGPIGGTPWVKQVLAGFIAAKVPRAKIDLGVAEYAYQWRANSSSGTSMSVARARSLAGSRARFDTRQQEWTATLANGSVLWWSDARTFAARRALAQQYGLHGLAVWELSLGDTIS
jgi:spore germination protein YaaH